MNAKELKSLSRGDLLELLLAQTERVERLEADLADARKRAEARDIIIERTGTLAEAAMQINRVWQAADQAAAQYLSNVMRIYDEQLEKNATLEREYAFREQELLEETAQKCREMEREAMERCRELEQEAQARYEEIVRKAEEEARVFWVQALGESERYCSPQDNLKALLQTEV